MIAPSILSADFYNLEDELQKIASAEWVHIDAMDGNFVPNLTFGPMVVEALRPHTEQFFDCHLMVDQPENYIEAFAEAGADMITIHAEATAHPHRALQMIKQAGVKAGLALNPGTPVEAAYPLLQHIDMLLIMTVNPGFGGQSFIETTLEKVATVHGWRQEKALDFLIEVDGGINSETGKQCVDAGADVLVAGSYVFKHENPEEAIALLEDLF